VALGNCGSELAASFRLLFLGQTGILQLAPGKSIPSNSIGMISQPGAWLATGL
jgi:hypothetical protein